MKIATTIGELYSYTATPADAIRAYEGSGFRWLDYSFYNHNTPGHRFLTDNWLQEIEESAEAAASLGFGFVQAHSPNYNPFVDPADQEYHQRGLLATIRSIEACGRLGIPNIVVHTGIGAPHLYPNDKENYFRANMPFIEALYPAMEKWNVRVCIENSAEANMGPYYFFMTGEEMNEFIDFANHPLLGACWDTGHGNMRHTDPYKELVTLGKNLHAVHFQDNDGHGDIHTAPFFGTLDVDAVMRGLIDAGYTGPLTFESDCFLPRRPGHGSGNLNHPPLAVKRACLGVLHAIGRACLDEYAIEEE